MGSQRQSHRVRAMEKRQDQRCAACAKKVDVIRLTSQTEEGQAVINGLIEQNHRLAILLNHYESKPRWWQLRAMREWRRWEWR